MFGELPELLIAISRSPARAKRSSGSANTSSYTWSLAVAVNSETSLNACARSRPFLHASAAKWLAIDGAGAVADQIEILPARLDVVGHLDPTMEAVLDAQGVSGLSVIARALRPAHSAAK